VSDEHSRTPEVPFRRILLEWGRLGVVGFGGPPTHISLLRQICVEKHRWIEAQEFEDAIAATNILPGPASTQLAIYCAWRLRGVRGALLGGFCFILPGLILIIALSALFLAHDPPHWVLGAAAGAGAAVPAVALRAAATLTPTSLTRVGVGSDARWRWVLYALLSAVTASILGSFVVLVLLGCGAIEVVVRRPRRERGTVSAFFPASIVHAVGLAGLGALAFEAFKVGALSYGGGFVIVPLMQHDVVNTYHWMSAQQFLNAVVLGQVTPGPVVLTVSAVGYAARGIAGALFAAVIAFFPSFLFVLFGASRFDRIRSNVTATAFLGGAGAAVVGAIAGSSIPLGLALHHVWQIPVLAAALIWYLLARRSIVSGLLLAGAIGVILALAGVVV
jgi:chromate transporter